MIQTSKKYFKKGGIIVAFFLLNISLGNDLHAQKEVEYAKEVFRNLIRSYNRTTPAPPRLVIGSYNDPARTEKNGEIFLDLRLVLALKSFGADSSDALAHVLAHELAHYYCDHSWTSEFGSAYASSDWGQTIAATSHEDTVLFHKETQADEYGMLYAFKAGYKTFELGPRVLDSVYKWYEPPTKGYPPLPQRKEIATLAKKKVADLVPVFDLAKLMQQASNAYSGKEQIELAELSGIFLDHIIQSELSTPEVLNNYAASKIIMSMQYFDDTIRQLRFPIMLDNRFAGYDLSGSRGSTPDSSMEKALSLLEDAELILKEALKLDRGQTAPHVNLAITYMLMQKWGSATDEIEELESLVIGGDNTWVLAELSGLRVFLKKRESDVAKPLLEAASASGSATSERNLQVMQGTFQPDLNFHIVGMDEEEKIENESVIEFLQKISGRTTDRAVTVTSRRGKFTSYECGEGTEAYIVKTKDSEVFTKSKVYFYRVTESADFSTSRGIKCGDDLKSLSKKYGDANVKLPESEGEVHIYTEQALMVWVKDDTITELCYWFFK